MFNGGIVAGGKGAKYNIMHQIALSEFMPNRAVLAAQSWLKMYHNRLHETQSILN